MCLELNANKFFLFPDDDDFDHEFNSCFLFFLVQCPLRWFFLLKNGLLVYRGLYTVFNHFLTNTMASSSSFCSIFFFHCVLGFFCFVSASTLSLCCVVFITVTINWGNIEFKIQLFSGKKFSLLKMTSFFFVLFPILQFFSLSSEIYWLKW